MLFSYFLLVFNKCKSYILKHPLNTEFILFFCRLPFSDGTFFLITSHSFIDFLLELFMVFAPMRGWSTRDKLAQCFLELFLIFWTLFYAISSVSLIVPIVNTCTKISLFIDEPSFSTFFKSIVY